MCSRSWDELVDCLGLGALIDDADESVGKRRNIIYLDAFYDVHDGAFLFLGIQIEIFERF